MDFKKEFEMDETSRDFVDAGFLGELKGKVVMIRTANAGVHYGTLVKARESGAEYSVKIINATRIYSWTGANSISQLAAEGSKRTDSQLSVEVPSQYLKAVEIIEMSPEAVENLNAIPKWKV
jgi:hypothetical protein